MTTDRPITMADLCRVLRQVLFDDNGYWRFSPSMAKQIDRIEAEEKERCSGTESQSGSSPQLSSASASSSRSSIASGGDDTAARALADAVERFDSDQRRDGSDSLPFHFGRTIQNLRDAASALLERYRAVEKERDAERALVDRMRAYLTPINQWSSGGLISMWANDVDAARKKGTP